MPDLIIGHTTDHSARIWIRGDSKRIACEVSIHPADDPADDRPPIRLELCPTNDYTGTVNVERLEPGIDYVVHAAFAPSSFHAYGRLCTMRKPEEGDTDAFSFVLSSCNLSVVSINDFLSFLGASAGISLARSSLRLPFHRWKRPHLDWPKRLIRSLLDGAIKVLAFSVNLFTDIKQPGPPLMRSPFLKLSAVFESVVLRIAVPSVPPPADRAAPEPEPPFLAVGDRVSSSDGATAVVASLGSLGRGDRVRRVVLTQVEGSFVAGNVLCRNVTSNSHERKDPVGTIEEAAPGRPWFAPPSFFMHAGDQIYFDFPSPRRRPRESEYRLAYREAWFEDEALRHVLAHWPHYMTLDDHEIADQFALDFIPPNDTFSPTEYLHEASVAYRDYVNALSPQQDGRPESGPYWYTFNKHRARFFVLDTRTQRDNKDGLIIDSEQMNRLLAWMESAPLDLKFVVTSVPFVAEINEATSEDKDDWFKNRPTAPRADGPDRTGHDAPQPLSRNPEQDKWSAARFRRQRDEIIAHIAEKRVEHLVFLTGDMHCCYHATMRIGAGLKKYESITIHELAGGPVNQLQLAHARDFERRSVKRTQRVERTDGGVDYEVTLDRFHGEVSAVMHVKVEHKQRAQVFGQRDDAVPELEWNVIRTLTDPGPEGWRTGAAGQRSLDLPASGPPNGESVMAGRISFVQMRRSKDLEKW